MRMTYYRSDPSGIQGYAVEIVNAVDAAIPSPILGVILRSGSASVPHEIQSVGMGLTVDSLGFKK
jgi:hypothetical protein